MDERLRLAAISIIFLLFSNVMMAQEEAYQGAFTNLPDTFKFAPPVPYLPVSIDSIPGVPTDTLLNQEVYLFCYSNSYQKEWRLVYRLENGWMSVLLSSSYESPDYVEFTDSIKVDLNSDGMLDVPLIWQSYAGHTGWENAVHERWGGIIIWDLKNHQTLFDFENFYKLESWWTEYAEDTTGTLSYEERGVINSGGERECDYYEILFAPKRIEIKVTDNCWNQEEKEDSPVFIYDLKGTHFIIRK